MDLPDCYRVLGLRTGASYGEVKASYRRLARQYHPDTNPGDQQAHDKFIQINEAYQSLLEVLVRPDDDSMDSSGGDEVVPRAGTTTGKPKVTVNRKSEPNTTSPPISEIDRKLKRSSYAQLQELLREQRFPRAIALVEGLAQRLPQDVEVKQWQAIAYQRWARHLIKAGDVDKARVYLKKALKTDPHNRSLWEEVNRDFQKLEEKY